MAIPLATSHHKFAHIELKSLKKATETTVQWSLVSTLKVDAVICERDVIVMRDLLTAAHTPELLRECLVRRSDVSGRATTINELLQLPRVRAAVSRRSFMSPSRASLERS